ncbi:MAG: glycosyltransferase family 39 protein [Anaerolineae bacterium]
MSTVVGMPPFDQRYKPSSQQEPTRRRVQRALLVVMALYVALGVVYSMVTPLYEAPDELYHYALVRHLAQGRGLPVQDPAATGPWMQEGGQPPLYYVLAALAVGWVRGDPADLLPPNPHADIGVARPDGNANMVVHSPAEGLFSHGAPRAIHLVRWLSVALGAVTVLFTYRIGSEVLPFRPWVALAAAGIVGFTPMFAFISGSVNNDNLAIALATVTVWQLLRLLRLPSAPGRWALVGITMGLACLTKLNGLTLLPLAGIILIWLSWWRREGTSAVWNGLCCLAPVAIIAGWWYLRNAHLYGDPLGLNVFVAIAGSRRPGFGLSDLAGEWSSFAKSYCGVFGWMNVVAPAWFYDVFGVIVAVGLAGLVAAGVRGALRPARPTAQESLRLCLLALWPAGVFVSLVRWSLMTPASQGRLLFPAIAATSFWLALGLASWLPKKWGDWPVLLAPALLLALAAWVPWGVIAPAYARPALMSAEQVNGIANRLERSFEGQVELLGYELPAQTLQPGDWLPVTLYWRAQAAMSEDYSVFVHLFDGRRVLIAQRDRYPGRGLFPTSQWRPGDALADTYYLRIPPDLAKPRDLCIEVGLYRAANGSRLRVLDADGKAAGDSIALGRISVRPASCAREIRPVQQRFADHIILQGYNLDRQTVRPGETIHLTLFWRAEGIPEADYTVFTHLLGAGDAMLGQEDAPSWSGEAPTSTWTAGRTFCDTYALTVRDDAPAGDARLVVGLYNPATMERLSPLGPDGLPQGDSILLGSVQIGP